MLGTLLLLAAPLLQQPSDKEVFDGVLNAVRPTQEQNGSYGDDATRTAEVLLALALSPRSYRVDDGPFVRDAAVWLSRQLGDTAQPEADALHALALAHVHPKLYKPTVDKLLKRNSNRSLADCAKLVGRPLAGVSLFDAMSAVPQQEAVHHLAAYAVGRAYVEVELPSQPAELIEPRPQMEAEYERGVDFLMAARGPSGMWEMYGQVEPGISSLAATALLGSKREAPRAVAMLVLDELLTMQKKDGSIHGGHHAVYTTSVAIGALVAGGRDQDKGAIDRAVRYLRVTQADEGEGYSEDEKFYGGIGYGGDLRPDLSNLQYAMQAMHQAGVGEKDSAFQRAIKFLERSQNRAESNPGEYFDQGSEVPIRAGNDGGAVYYPGNSMAGTEELPDGRVIARSYGSMTYALLKCYVFAGLTIEDPRVHAAVEWISARWTLEVNPGFDTMKDPRAGFQGLYYYYLSVAQALDAAKIEQIDTPSGRKHLWRAELAAKLASLQASNGSWVNLDAPRWYEGDPVLCTAYALNAIRSLRGGN